MKTKTKRLLLGGLATALLLWSTPNAFAALSDTSAGTTISNQATIGYSVGGVAQTAVLSDGDTGTPGNQATTFVVDHKVRPVVTLTANRNVIPGATGDYLTFQVANDGNTNPGTLALRMTTAALGTPPDDFDMTNVQIYLDNGNGTFEGAPTDTLVTNADINLARDTSATVFVVADTPATALNAQTAMYDLIATAWSGGAALQRDTDGDNPNLVEVVWVDDAGSASGDAQYDGRHSARGTFTVQSALLSVVKSSTVISDPVNGATNPLRIPLSRVRYSITINNTGAAAASGVTITDTIPTSTNFYVGSVSGGTGTYSNDNGSTWTFTPMADPDGSDSDVTNVRITLAGPIAQSGNATVSFDVLIE
jgi:uncharacterized repeat protein (TIGR01451 family)